MKVIGSIDYDDFGAEIIFWVAITDLPKSVQEEAKRIDGDAYTADCFGICVCYDTNKKEFALSPDEQNTNIYYVKDSGDKVWFMVELPEGFLAEVFRRCQKALTEPAEA